MNRIANAITESEKHEEIEVTPEMIEAGAGAYYALSTRYNTVEEIVTEIYSRMAEAKAVTRPDTARDH